MERKWQILTIILSLITGIVIGYSLKTEPAFSIYALLASSGLTFAWLINMMRSAFRESESERIRQEQILINDLKKWLDIPTKIELLQKDGEKIPYPTKIYQSLVWRSDDVDVLNKNKIYSYWKNGIKNSYNILSEGRNAYRDFLVSVDEKLKTTSLKKIMSLNLEINTYSYPLVCNAIAEKINGDNRPLDLSATIAIKDKSWTYLKFGTRDLACGRDDELSDFKNLIVDLICDEKVKENIRKLYQAKKDLNSKQSFNAFEIRLNKLLLDWERFHKFKPQP